MKLKLYLIGAVFPFCLASMAMAQEVEGSWLGVLGGGPAGLQLGVRLQKTPDGTYSGTFSSLDQGAWDLPVTNVIAGRGSLSFALASPAAQFAGQWDDVAHQWVGTWTQNGRRSKLNFSRGMVPPSPELQGLRGDWDGVMERNGARLRLSLHIHSLPGGGLSTTIDSIDQVTTFPITRLVRNSAELHLAAEAAGWTFDGVLDPGEQTIGGRWGIGKEVGPLTFARRRPGSGQATANRPQIPVKPYPYREEEVTYDSVKAGVRLAGTLTLPAGAGPFPVAVLIAGSGAATRDEPIFGHRPFLVLADYLTRHGIAVLRSDKRGVGASTGDYATASTRDFADDVEGGLSYLRSRKDIDPLRIGLIGHSEGGVIAPLVASEDRKVAFVVLMAAPAQTGAEILVEQTALIARANGLTERDVEQQSSLQRQLISVVRQEGDPERARAEVRQLLIKSGLSEHAAALQAFALASEWRRFFIDYDPVPALRGLTCPVLALAGDKDLQVPAPKNLAIIRSALVHNRDALVVELPGINHVLQEARIGTPTEYAQIEESISPAILDLLTSWITKRVSHPAR